MNATEQATSSNFGFLGARYPDLERIGARSERYFSDDPIISLITVRRFGEVLAQLVAAGSGLFTDVVNRELICCDTPVVDGNYPRGSWHQCARRRIEGEERRVWLK